VGATASRASLRSPKRESSYARGCKVPDRRLAAALLALALIAPSAFAERQQRPELRTVLQKATTSGQCFTEKYDAEVWYKLMGPRLRKYVKDLGERIEILTNVYCEARHTQLPAELVLAVMDVESSFNRWAVSPAGAQGLMQVMPFWPEQLGMKRHPLVQGQPNIRMGCAVLKFFYERAPRHRRTGRALGPSPGHEGPPCRYSPSWRSIRAFHRVDSRSARTHPQPLQEGFDR